MLSMGESGYIESVKKILETAKTIIQGIDEIDELRVMGDPLWVISFESKEMDIYKIMDQMTKKGWNLNGLQKPACVHICITLRHTKEGVAERFITDLKQTVSYVKKNPSDSRGMAPVYGMATSIPFKGIVKDLLKKYIDLYYKV
jgi:glutamate/tyrosine decarboxylase-like PLP-dependent enzyme